MSETTHDLSGRIFGGQFRLETLLRRGGMGEVYLAEQLGIARRVVIKLLHATQLGDPELNERLEREAQMLARLNHPNIVHLYMFGRSEDGSAFLVMEYIEGPTLASLLEARGALPESEVLRILEQIVSALVEAHAHGIIHRDLKPDNVMLSERTGQAQLVKVLDFGIAKLMRDSNPRLTQSGVLLGTPRYMAPEQAGQRATDERTDIYALGLIGYELLTGQVPFEAENTVALLVRVSNEEAIAPSRKAPSVDVSAATEAVIMRCLAKEPSRRFQSAQALREALAAIPREETLSAAPVRLHLAGSDTSLPAAETRGSRALLRIVGGAVLLCGLGAAGAVWLRGGRHSVPLTAAASGVAATEPLSVAEWIQGIPFPAGVQFKRFEPEWIDARVPASAARVFAFYRAQLNGKWGGFRDLDGVLVFEDPAALIKTLTVGPVENGSRVSIARRPPHNP